MCSPGTATEAGELSRGGKSVILPQHLIGDHLGLDDVGHGSPHLDGLHARFLPFPEGQQPCTSTRTNKYLPVSLEQAWMRLRTIFPLLLTSSSRTSSDYWKFHVKLDFDVELLVNLFISVNLITEAFNLLLSKRVRAKSLFYFSKSSEFLREVLRMFALRAGEVNGAVWFLIIKSVTF